ncbi:MAG: hypothetical protein JEZ14_24320 [Marinilabiliaceae bacterium]|nr:hypothetical protein [Marinilabiliaceae bacterium]
MKTIAHHTCKKEGGIDYVISNVPFYAEHNVNEEKYQFLGSGYYFWDDNIELAKSWGKFHYNNDFHVFEFDFEINSDNCLDLVGNRSHQKYFMELFRIYEEHTGDTKENWSICQCIEFLKILTTKNEKIFPFKMIRAIDLLNHNKYKEQFRTKFVAHKGNYTVINPKMVICVITKQDVPLQSKKIVFTSLK